jgi:anti-sigma factor RsiW
MDCKDFANHHSAYIDDTLPGFRMAAMRDHLTSCSRCSKRDNEVRRALFVLKNIQPIQVSEGFEDRLRARITAEGPAYVPQKSSSVGAMKWAAAAALVVTVAGVSSWTSRGHGDVTPTRLAAVFVAVPSTYESEDASAPAYVASMSTGIPMWPALMLAEEGPRRFAVMQNATLVADRPND